MVLQVPLTMKVNGESEFNHSSLKVIVWTVVIVLSVLSSPMEEALFSSHSSNAPSLLGITCQSVVFSEPSLPLSCLLRNVSIRQVVRYSPGTGRA